MTCPRDLGWGWEMVIFTSQPRSFRKRISRSVENPSTGEAAWHSGRERINSPVSAHARLRSWSLALMIRIGSRTVAKSLLTSAWFLANINRVRPTATVASPNVATH